MVFVPRYSGTVTGALPDDILSVENTLSDDVSVVGVRSLRVERTIAVGGHPDDVVVAPDGRTVFVNRQGPRDLVAVDAKTGDVAWSVAIDGLPHHLALSRDGRHLYVAVFDDPRDAVVDVDERAVVARPATGLGAHGVFLGPTGERFYVGSMLVDHIAVVDAATFEPVRTIPMDEGVRPFALTRAEDRLYAQLSRRHGFVVVDLATDEVAGEVDLPPLPPGIEPPRRFPHTVNHGLALTPDDRLLLAAATIAGYVAVYALPAHDLVATIEVGREPGWVTMSGDGSACYVSNRADGTVSIISVPSLREAGRVRVGAYPQRMAAAPRR
jgi:YVTN family beta-propeller protein